MDCAITYAMGYLPVSRVTSFTAIVIVGMYTFVRMKLPAQHGGVFGAINFMCGT